MIWLDDELYGYPNCVLKCVPFNPINFISRKKRGGGDYDFSKRHSSLEALPPQKEDTGNRKAVHLCVGKLEELASPG